MSWNREKQAQEIIPPILGQVAVINCSTTVQVIDLTSFPASTTDPAQANDNPIGKYVRITAQGGDVYFVTGSNFALLNAIPNTTVFSTVNATTGKVTFNNNGLDCISNGAWKDFVAMPGGTPRASPNVPAGGNSPCRYVALMTSAGNATARVEQSST